MDEYFDPGVLDELQGGADGIEPGAFREDSERVGSVFLMSYSHAVIAVFDHDREAVGGLPRGMFLLAARKDENDFILLRVLDVALLENTQQVGQIRQAGVEDSANEEPWGENLDKWTHSHASLHGLNCRVLGTFQVTQDDRYRFFQDIDNFYAVSNLLVFKPGPRTLDMIANYAHQRNDVSWSREITPVGRTRFSAAERPGMQHAEVRLDPTDLLRRRTVYLGMSRSGKSNALKITAEAIYRLRDSGRENPQVRIGQLIFDLSGEYAQDNPQDGLGLHRVHRALKLPREPEVQTYGLQPTPSDPDRKAMKINFYGDPIPFPWDQVATENALRQLFAGREHVQEALIEEQSKYVKSFRDADIAIPEHAAGDRGLQTRYRRAILAYQAALFAAGLEPPNAWQPSVSGLFGGELVDALSADRNPVSDQAAQYETAKQLLEKAKGQKGRISWKDIETVFVALNKFIEDGNSYYPHFENAYTADSDSGEKWADARLQNLLRIFAYPNGPRSFQRVQEQHGSDSRYDFVDQVVEDLYEGKLVIIDQSAGAPEQNQKAAERVMWKVFRAQQEQFKTSMAEGKSADDVEQKHILVYVEEAHNLLPKVHGTDILKTVWARAAKEGSKFNLGMVLATQAPSSILPEILSETDNWIIGHLNSMGERRVVAGYMDFEDFIEQIGRVSEQGFVRLRTLSRAYTVTTQFNKFRLKG